MRYDSDYMKNLYDAYGNGDTIFDYLVGEELRGKIVFPHSHEEIDCMKTKMIEVIVVFLIVGCVLVDSMIGFIYIKMIRPFHKLEKFASDVAIGNLDLPLEREESNYFGAFTESFDIMRTELKAARDGEARANQSKKELVASLSHDIKTPVATIKALCEILEIKLKESDLQIKVHKIQQKADTIDQLISNMFQATLSELEALKINVKMEPSTMIEEIISGMDIYGKIQRETKIPSCLIQCDSLRLTQVLENIISNSYKYANTMIHIYSWETDTQLCIQIRDEGQEIEDLDLALVYEKFFRGNNTEGKSGSGLGLYLAKLFMTGMGGELVCEKDSGFVVTIALQKAGKEREMESTSN